MAATSTPVHFLNVEYFFRLIYEALNNIHTGSVHIDILGLVTAIWLSVCAIGFLVSVFALFILIQSTMRLYQIKAQDALLYATIHDAHHAEEVRDHSRWDHVMNLIESPHESDWRQAIIEADIMLDDLLVQLGYMGGSVGDRLKQVDPARFRTIRDAWDGHMVRNAIAHQGSSYQLSDQMAYRTIHHYEAVMREHGEI